MVFQDAFVTQVTKLIERKNEDTQEVKSGWFTPNQMKTELKWDAFLNFIIQYVASHEYMRGM